jgi:hypothetical protein
MRIDGTGRGYPGDTARQSPREGREGRAETMVHVYGRMGGWAAGNKRRHRQVAAPAQGLIARYRIIQPMTSTSIAGYSGLLPSNRPESRWFAQCRPRHHPRAAGPSRLTALMPLSRLREDCGSPPKTARCVAAPASPMSTRHIDFQDRQKVALAERDGATCRIPHCAEMARSALRGSAFRHR